MKRLLRVTLLFAVLPAMFMVFLWSKPAAPERCAQAWKLVLSRPGDLGVKFDEGVPDRYAAAMAQALHYWEQTIFVRFHEDANTDTCSIELSTEENDNANTLAESILPIDISYDGAISVNLKGDIQKVPDDKLVYVFIHEIGHIMGLKHNQDDTSVMYPSMDGGIVLMPSDLKALSLYHELNRAIYQMKETQ